MKCIGKYINGNYEVTIFDDGTKIRKNDLDFFKPDMPESMDIKITNFCLGPLKAITDDEGNILYYKHVPCPMCHENSSPKGIHGQIMHLKFIETLHPYTELAIGGGNPLMHPDLIPFLRKCKDLKLIPSITINQSDLAEQEQLVRYLVNNKLIYGLGVSLINPTDEFITLVKEFPNAVIHVIAGLVTEQQLEELANKGLKILILGYKQFRRGKDLYNKDKDSIDKRIQELKDNLEQVASWFDVVSFDNLAIKQLDPKRILTDEEYDEFFLGEDGFASLYVDCVKQEFARSSTSTERYPLMDNIKDMFEVIRK